MHVFMYNQSNKKDSHFLLFYLQIDAEKSKNSIEKYVYFKFMFKNNT